MYELVDRPIGRLCGGSRFVLRAMRAWADAVGRGTCPPGVLATPFLRQGVIDALPGFHRFMCAVCAGARDTVMLNPLGCGAVGEWEAILLGAWADVATAPARVRDTLALLLDGEAAEAAFAALVIAEARLAAAGLAPLGITDAARAG